MKTEIQVNVFRGEAYYVAECLDLPVVTQAKTLDELTVNIKEAIELHLEGEDFGDKSEEPMSQYHPRQWVGL
jgi:predicted RNase H-like HicB family nuclease